MRAWQEDQIGALSAAQNENDRFQIIADIARELDFDFCAYGVRLPLPFSQPKTVMFNNYPVAWQETYKAKGYLDVDPTVKHGMRSSIPILWTDDLFTAAREFWEDARSFGLNHGWAQSGSNLSGAIGMLSLGRSEDLILDSEIKHKTLQMNWLKQLADLALTQQVVSNRIPEASVTLSSREIEALKWTADGKTSGQISEILHITERTVNFHIQNAMFKLNAANKTAATVRAAVLGLLS